MNQILIGGLQICVDSPTFIIAEIGINHNGDFDLAMRLIDLATESGADCVKFQMRDLEALYMNAGQADDIKENLSTQYTLDLLSKFQLSHDQMYACFDRCKDNGIIPLCTPWDLPTLDLLDQYGLDGYKIASADLTNHDLLQAAARTNKALICSTGMSYHGEIDMAVEVLKKENAKYALLHCNSTYPPHMKDVNLNFMNRLGEIGDCVVGYSGHERGYHIPVAAVTMGAKIIEKHFTIDRNMEGNDHKVSLRPDEFRNMVSQIRDVEKALGTSDDRNPNQGELMNRVNLAKSLVAKCDIKKGDTIMNDMLDVRSPGRGLQPNYRSELISTLAKRGYKKGDFFFPSDLPSKSNQIGVRHYTFNRRWGIPVRYHDFETLLAKSNPDFIEFHLSYKDMEEDHHRFFDGQRDMGLVVHSPDTFSGDHLLNLASEDDSYRERSIVELQRVIDLTNDLKQYFICKEMPKVVVSVGGFSQDSFFGSSKIKKAYDRVADSLSRLDKTGVTILPQTLPPFPWYFGGQLHCNLFVNPRDTAEFCRTHGYQICYDVSHSKLACNYLDIPLNEFTSLVGSYSSHLHLVDGAGLDSEGLQIGEGEIDFAELAIQLNNLTPSATFIPEIWMGHENEGEKQWLALERLERFDF